MQGKEVYEHPAFEAVVILHIGSQRWSATDRLQQYCVAEASAAVDEIRVDIRRNLIAEDNSRDKSEPPVTYSNGETMRQILASSKHTLMMAQNKWTDIQRHSANILFKHYPILKSVYQLAMELRRIFNLKISPTKALGMMNKWYEKVTALDNSNFRSVIKTFRNHAPTIINYFRRRATNASAEVFN